MEKEKGILTTKSPKKSLAHINTKIEFLFFKDDILKDMKNLEKKILEKYNKFDLAINEEVNNINNNINSINSKISELSNLITADNMMKEKINDLENIKKQLFTKMLFNEIKVNNIDKETKESIINMNDILKKTVIYKGLIGPSCKFSNFHELIDFILHELQKFDNYKVKTEMDLSFHKKKTDDNIYGLKLQMESLAKSSSKLTSDNFNVHNKKIKEINQKIEKITKNLEDINIRLDEIDNKLVEDINKLKKDNENNVTDFNNHIKDYIKLKEDINNIKETENKKWIYLKKMNPKVPNDIQLSFNKKSWKKYFLCIQKIMNPPSLNFICFFRTTFPLFHDVQLFFKKKFLHYC
jgi:DNA repair exonuclease SbcCD ATPase subunit